MALPPADAAPMGDEEAAVAEAPVDAPMEDEVEPGDENVLFTVCKEPDGSYSLIKGDEEDASGMDAAGSADMETPAEDTNKQTFTSPGALLKAILDMLNEDAAAASGEGAPEDEFQSGFSGEEAPAAGGAAPKPMM